MWKQVGSAPSVEALERFIKRMFNADDVMFYGKKVVVNGVVLHEYKVESRSNRVIIAMRSA